VLATAADKRFSFPGIEVDLIPGQIHQFRNSEAVAVGGGDHDRVTKKR
jgi:hypothetical protein